MATLEITTRIGCKNMCDYCPQKLLLSNYSSFSNVFEMSLETFQSCMLKIPKSVRIDFSGFSEPWLNPECTRMIVKANDLNFKIAVYTTCVGMRLEDLEQIRSIPFVIFNIHLPDNENHTRIKIDEKYIRILNQITKHPPSNCSFIYFKTIHPKVEKILHKHKVHALDIQNAQISRAGNLKRIFINSSHREYICSVSKDLNNNVLLPNGDVVLCCMDYGLKHRLGNLLLQNYDSIMKGDKLRFIKKSLNANSGKGTICNFCEKRVPKNSFEFWQYFFKIPPMKQLRLILFLSKSGWLRFYFQNPQVFIKKIKAKLTR
jgi:hypothetical protein